MAHCGEAEEADPSHVVMIDTVLLTERLPGEDGYWHACYADRILDALDQGVQIMPCIIIPVLHSLPRGDPKVAAALSRMPPCPQPSGCQACLLRGQEEPVAFEESRWGDSIEEAAATVWAPRGADAMRTVLRAFTRPSAKGLRMQVARLYPPLPLPDVGHGLEYLVALRDARRTALRGVLCPPNSEAREKWLKQALDGLDPYQKAHAPLIALLCRHYPVIEDPQVRGMLQVVVSYCSSMLCVDTYNRARVQLVASVPIVRLSGRLRSAFVGGWLTEELVRREMRCAHLRGYQVPELPPPPTRKCGCVWNYFCTIRRDGTCDYDFDINQDLPAEAIVPTCEWLGVWPWERAPG